MLQELGLKFPLIVAPMAGGPTSVELVVASSESGALGSVGAAYLKPSRIEEFVAQVRSKTARPFSINLFVPAPEKPPIAAQIDRAIAATAKYRRELALPEPILREPFAEDFAKQFSQVMELKPAALSFIFGLLDSAYVAEVKRRKIYLIGTATSRDEAEQLEALGVDAMTLQGVEAGGHRGIFAGPGEQRDPLHSTLDLLKSCVGKIAVPLIAAGGIMNSADIRAALAAGASAVQMGTAFLTCREAGTSPPYRQALLESAERSSQTTRVFSGRLARGLRNRFMTEMEALGTEAILPFPAQNVLTRELREASGRMGLADFLSLWAGAGKGPLWTGSAGELVKGLFASWTP